MVGISVFRKGADGTVFHTYSTYSRGVDMLNTARHWQLLEMASVATLGRRFEDGRQLELQFVQVHAPNLV